jgi:hypothetical protein
MLAATRSGEQTITPISNSSVDRARPGDLIAEARARSQARTTPDGVDSGQGSSITCPSKEMWRS